MSYKTHGQSYSVTYGIWRGMKKRCSAPNYVGFDRYGGRGIVVCERWRDSFSNFLEDMGQRPDGMSLDRIDNDGPYSPDNCRWATPRTQSNNLSNNNIVELFGKAVSLSQASRALGVSRMSIKRRLERGVPLSAPWKRTRQNAARLLKALESTNSSPTP